MTTDPRVTLSELLGIPNANLTIENIGKEPFDRGHYTCVATAPGGDRFYHEGNNATVFVRVKGSYVSVHWFETALSSCTTGRDFQPGCRQVEQELHSAGEQLNNN